MIEERAYEKLKYSQKENFLRVDAITSYENKKR